MHAKLYMDPRIRDYVFLPLVLLMFGLQFLRIFIMRWMNEPKNKLKNPANCAYTTLFGTIFEKDADKERKLPDGQLDIIELLENGYEQDLKEGAALSRAAKCRTLSMWLPERSVRLRKAYYCHEQNGYLEKKTQAANPMAMMQNPDMMNQMLKQNVQSVLHMSMFTGIGSVFQGFITAQVPFPLGYKFKQMLQQGLNVHALDPTYVSSMSWAFLLIYGLNGVMSMILQDKKSIEEMELMASGAGMVT